LIKILPIQYEKMEPNDVADADMMEYELYKKVRNTNWSAEEDCKGKPRGRKAKAVVRPESVPRTEGERIAKQQGFNKWIKK
jgi:hypothetical protein